MTWSVPPRTAAWPRPALVDWYDANAGRYDALEAGLTGDAAFYTALARAHPPVLELGCGTGRVTLAIARAGVAVTGLDLSAGMLAVARRKGADAPAVRWLRGDMRAFDLGERFGLICIPHRTFQHLLTEAEQRATLACCRAHLRAGGRLALNVFNPPEALLARAGRGGASVVGEAYAGLPVRYVRAAELWRLLTGAGFRVEGLYGWFDRRPFRADSPEQVWVAVAP
jgi:SAM-dependent methyltransferase